MPLIPLIGLIITVPITAVLGVWYVRIALWGGA